MYFLTLEHLPDGRGCVGVSVLEAPESSISAVLPPRSHGQGHYPGTPHQLHGLPLGLSLACPLSNHSSGPSKLLTPGFPMSGSNSSSSFQLACHGGPSEVYQQDFLPLGPTVAMVHPQSGLSPGLPINHARVSNRSGPTRLAPWMLQPVPTPTPAPPVQPKRS